jgi:hypothetical protein
MVTEALKLRRPRHVVLSLLILLCPTPRLLGAQESQSVLQTDSDHDGMTDALEQSLLLQFVPKFMLSRQECSSLPAEFIPGLANPIVQDQNGTIYGQVFPAKVTGLSQTTAEIHFYHLWKQDCGAHGHQLDAEHVSVLVGRSSDHPISAPWKALYWYAAAHENTICDVSQITRASAVGAEEHGPTVWISAGKHASFLNETLCQGGCGADLCQDMVPLGITQVINLGERDEPMNGALWINSSEWLLAGKMASSDFPDSAIARLNSLPSREIALFNAGRHPMHATVAISGVTANAVAKSGTDTASAVSVGEASTGNALRKSYDKTIGALGSSARHVGKALHLKPKAGSEK